MIELRNLSLSLSGRKLIDDLSWTLPDPGVYLLIGGNASGKSLIARIISGRQKPSRGSVLIDGDPLYALWGGYGQPVFHASASECLLDDEPLEAYVEAELLRAGADRKLIRHALDDLTHELKLDPARPLSRLAHSELLLCQVLLAASIPLRLSVLDGHLTYFDRYFLGMAVNLLQRVQDAEDRFVLLTASRLASGFPPTRGLYMLSGGMPLELYEKPLDAAVDTGLNPVYGASGLRIYTQGLAQSMAGITSGTDYLILSQLEDGLRVQLRGSLDGCLKSLRTQGLIIRSVEWESVE